MSAKVIPLFPGPPPLRERLAARRAYRVRCQEVALRVIAKAFSDSGKGIAIGIDDATPLFVAAMRRELRRTGLF